MNITLYKFTKILSVTLLFLFINIGVTAQNSNIRSDISHEIKLKSRSFVPEVLNSNEKPEIGKKGNVIIQFNEKLNAQTLEELRNAEIIVHGRVSSTSLSIFVDDYKKFEKISNVRWIGALEAQDKISNKVKEMTGDYYLIVVLHNKLNKTLYEQNISQMGAEIKFNPYLAPNHILVKANKHILHRLAELDEVSYFLPASKKIVDAEPVHHCPGSMSIFGYIPQFVATGFGWDGPGLGSANLKYRFINGTPDASDENAEVYAALDTWSKYVQVNWTNTPLSGQNKSIDISWGSGDHGDAWPFDNQGGIMAHCFYPDDINSEPIAGDMHFDEDEFWRVGADIDLYTVALHEAGHGLGLNHSDDDDAIMYAYYSGAVGDLRNDDIIGIRSLYASRNTERTSVPVFNPVNGTYPSPLEVRLQYGSGSNNNNTRIKYTLNGSEPTPYSFEFVPGTDYIFQRFSNTIKARAFSPGKLPSNVVTADYILEHDNPTVINPIILPGGGTFSQPVQVFMNTTTDFAVIRYTTNGSEPTEASFAYTSPITIQQSTVIKAKAFRNDYTPSQTVTANLTILTNPEAPQFYPSNGGVFTGPVSVTISNSTPGSQIYYTTDGNLPTVLSTIYTQPISIETTTLLKAVSILNNNSSEISSAWFNITSVTLPAPTIYPFGGEFDSNVTVYLGSTVLGAVIRYTTNGAEPTSYSSIYTNPFSLGIGEHSVKAKIYLDGYTPSGNVEANFTVYDPDPQFVADPVVWPRSTNTFTEPIPLDMTCATEGAVIRYTVGFGQLPDDPTATGGGSITYTGPVNIGAPGQDMFLKVQAFKNGMNPSNIIQTGKLSVVDPLGLVENPVFDPEPGIFNNTVSVAMATPTQFAQIIYTKDGSEPDTYLPITIPSATYNAPVLVIKSMTFNAQGRRTFFSDSEVITGEYILQCGKPEMIPDSGNFIDSVTAEISTITENSKIYYTLDGSEPNDSSSLYEGPIKFGLGNYVIRMKTYKFGFENSETAFAEINVMEAGIAPVITENPNDLEVVQGETAKFYIKASGNPSPYFQWMREGVSLPGETKDSLILDNIQLGDAGMYSVMVMNNTDTLVSSAAELTVISLTSAEEDLLPGIPDNYELYGNYPNPFNPTTRIKYAIPENSKVTLNIFNIIGEKVVTLTNEIRNAGFYETNWDASQVSSGIYFVRFSASSLSSNQKVSKVHKLILVK